MTTSLMTLAHHGRSCQAGRQARPHPEERRLRRVSKDGPHGGLMVRDGASAPPHHEGRTFHVAKYATRKDRFVSCAFAPRVECWSAIQEESKGVRIDVRLAIRFQQKPRRRQ